MDKLKKISHGLFIAGSTVAIGSVGYTFYLRQTAPPGFCPLNPLKPYMWVGLVLLTLSLGLDGFMSYKIKQ